MPQWGNDARNLALVQRDNVRLSSRYRVDDIGGILPQFGEGDPVHAVHSIPVPSGVHLVASLPLEATRERRHRQDAKTPRAEEVLLVWIDVIMRVSAP